MGIELHYTIPGNPITKKNSQRILRNKKTGVSFIAPSAKYKAYEKAARQYLAPVPDEPISTKVEVRGVYYMETRRRVDLVNLLEASCDLLVHHGILADDNSNVVYSHDGSRVLYDKENPRAEITITSEE